MLTKKLLKKRSFFKKAFYKLATTLSCFLLAWLGFIGLKKRVACNCVKAFFNPFAYPFIGFAYICVA
jgi:hypothetical protein